MAEHSTTVELFYGGAWHTVPALQRAPVGCSRGAPGEGQDAPPSSASATANNASGDYNPRDPSSALYGAAGRNTPMRITSDASVRATVEASSWRPQRVKGSAWTPIVGGGILRRVQQGKTPLRAPLERAIRFQNPAAFWPLNDGTAAQHFASGLPAGAPITIHETMRPGLVTGPAGTTGLFVNLVSEEYETVSGDNVGSYAGRASVVVPALDPAGWAVEGIFLIERIEAGKIVTASSAVRWDVTGSVGVGGWSISLSGSSDGTCDITVAGASPGFFSEAGVVLAPGLHYFRFVAEQNGADVDVSLYVDGVLEETDTVTAVTLGVPTELRIGDPVSPEFAVQNARTAMIGMLAFTNLADSVDNTDAAGGHDGELAGVRFLRLGDEEGIVTVVLGDETDTPAMGPQPVATFVDNLRECVRTDGGLMLEPRDQLAIGMRPLRDMYNQAAALTIDAQADIEPGLAPVLDDFAKVNKVTAKRANGSEATFVKTTGPLNVNDPTDDPDGVGVYDSQLDVNPADDATLIDHASYAVAKGTVDEPRWPQITINLDRRPSLIAGVNALQLGDRIELNNLDHLGFPDPASVIVIGEAENLPKRQRRVTYNLAPASPYEVAIVGANDGSTDLRGAAVGTDLSTLDGGISSSATAVVIDSGGVAWTTDADDWNPALNGGGLFVGVGGEKMRVTNITGAGSAWTLTVVRSINGVVKSHADGDKLYVWTVARVGK